MDGIKVAGVTFCNNDGQSRQEILKQIGFGWATAYLKQTVYNGERAVEVWIEEKQIGYIPKTALNNKLSYYDSLSALILYFEEKDIYYVELYECETFKHTG